MEINNNISHSSDPENTKNLECLSVVSHVVS
jgi:hypothetical protein